MATKSKLFKNDSTSREDFDKSKVNKQTKKEVGPLMQGFDYIRYWIIFTV